MRANQPLSQSLVLVVLLAAVAADPGCVPTDEGACAGVQFPTAAAGRALRVSASCGTASGDGSGNSAFVTIGAALAAAQAGDTVVVAAGNYGESLNIKPGVHLIGVGRAAVIVEPANATGIVVSGAGATRIEGLTIKGAKGFGIGVVGAEVGLKNVRVEGTGANAKNPGNGISAEGAKSLSLDGCQVVDSVGVGVAVKGSGPVSIIDPLFLKNPQGAARNGTTVGIIDPLFLPQSQITGNKSGGVAIIDPLFSPGSDAAAPNLTLSATDIARNGKFGVALYGASAAITRSAIRDTAINGGDAAEGVLVAPRSVAATSAAVPVVTIDKATVVTNCARAGILVAAAANVQVAAEVSLSGRGGIWAQGSATKVTVSAEAHLAQNKMVGIVVTGSATLDFNGGRVSDTKPKQWANPAGGPVTELADGIGVFGLARGSIKGAVLKGNPRAGIIGNNCAATSDGLPDLRVEATTISGSKYGVVVHGSYGKAGTNAAASAAPADKGNSYDVATESSSDDLPVADSLCDDGKKDCTP